MALEKDSGHVKALIVMGQARLQEGLHAEATDHLERAISNVTYTSFIGFFSTTILLQGFLFEWSLIITKFWRGLLLSPVTCYRKLETSFYMLQFSGWHSFIYERCTIICNLLILVSVNFSDTKYIFFLSFVNNFFCLNCLLYST